MAVIVLRPAGVNGSTTSSQDTKINALSREIRPRRNIIGWFDFVNRAEILPLGHVSTKSRNLFGGLTLFPGSKHTRGIWRGPKPLGIRHAQGFV
jgi:hypothetical protein